MRKERWERVKVTSRKIFTLAYADDVVLTEKEEDMRAMVYKIEKYLERKRLELNVKKLKMMRFKKDGSRGKDDMEMERERGGG